MSSKPMPPKQKTRTTTARDKIAGTAEPKPTTSRPKASKPTTGPRGGVTTRKATDAGEMYRATVYLPAQDWQALRVLAVERSTTASELVQEALRAHLKIGKR